MTRLPFACIAVLFSTLLSGCYESASPLIAAGDAEFPFGARVRYTSFEWKDTSQMWEDSEPGTTSRDGDHYVQTPDGSAPGDAQPFRLKSIGGGLYVGQEEANSRYAYDLLRIDGDTVYEYALSCEDADRQFQTQGLIDEIKNEGLLGNTCTVSSLDKLGQVFRALAQSHQPKAKFVIQR